MEKTRCQQCPVAADRPCVGESSPIFCGWAASDSPERRQHVVLRSEIEYTPPPAPAPGLLRKAANLGKAVVEHVAAGLPMADDATARERLAICATCENYEGTSCRLCGCHLNFKVRWSEQKCPISKW